MKYDSFLDKINNLKRIPRTGWLLCNIPTTEAEDVAQHSFDVAVITLVLADELEHLGIKFDRERAVIMAIVHDWAEALVGDFPYTAIGYLKKDVKKQIERSALDDLLKDLPGKEKYSVLWQEYNEKRTPEAKLVHVADYLSIVVQAIKYRERGNQSRELDELWNAVEKDLQPYIKEFPWLSKLYESLRKRFSSIS